LDFNYSDDATRDLCEKRAIAVTMVGEQAALELERRLADIDACDTASDFAALCGNELVQTTDHRWTLTLVGGLPVLLMCGHAKPRITSTGATDWSKVTKFRIDARGGTYG
jgi:hypothetical protein